MYKRQKVWKKTDVETFVITEGNGIQAALNNQNLSSFNISSATCYRHIIFVGFISTWQSQISPENVRRLVAPSIIFRLIFTHVISGYNAELLALQLIQ